MIWTFKIELILGYLAEEEWICVIEIDCSSTLEELHFAIQDAVGFDNDHLYEFYIARTERSRDRVRFDDENEEIYELTLDDLYPLDKGKKFFYLFDYGDHWLFNLSKSRKKSQQPEKDIKYPRIIEKTGKNPEQYPEWEE
ncbi:MAG: hypothetical protein V3V18_08740 [Methylococcales bacterium]